MSRERFQSTGKTYFYGDYLHDRLVPRGTFLRKVVGWSSEQLERIRHRTWRDRAPQTDADSGKDHRHHR